MFQVYCPAHQSAVLLTTSRITALHNAPDGMRVEWRCWCGHQGETAHGRTQGGHAGGVDEQDGRRPALAEAS